jgi:cytoskeleton protein RodZ
MVEEQSGHSSAAASAGAQALSVGAMLADARAAKGRELTEIARETRVPLRHLMAIEADDHEALPALPYTVGFVKAFARAVGLEAEAVGARFRAETRLAPHVPSVSSLEPVDEARLPSRGLAFAALGALVMVLVGLGLYGSGVFDAAPQPDSIEVAGPDESGDPAPAPAAAALPPAAVPAAAPVAGPAAIPATGPVVLTARQDVWLRIQDPATRRRAFMGVLSAGQSWAVPAGPPLIMRTGRAGVIEIRVAGVLLPPLGTTNQTVDGVVLTAPALAERFDGIAAAVQTPAAAPPVQVGVSPAAARPAVPPATGG